MRRSLVLLLVARAAVAGDLSLSLSPEVRCVDEASLAARLRGAGLHLSPTGALDVDLSQAEAGVRLRARRSDGRLFVRTIPLRGGCEGIEAAVATLIREWFGSGFTSSAADGGAPPMPRPRTTGADLQAPHASAVERATPDRPAMDVGGTNEALGQPAEDELERNRRQPGARPPDGGEADGGPPAPSGAAPRPQDRPLSDDPGVEPRPPPPAPPTDAGTASPDEGVELRAGLGGGLQVFAGAPASPTGAVTVEVGSHGWGASVEFALNSDVTVTQTQLSVNLESQVLTLAVRRRLAWRRLALDLALGLRGTRLAVTPRGLEGTTTTALLSGGPVILTTGWLRLVGPVHAFLRLSAGLRLPAEALVIVNGPDFRLGIAQLSAIAGLALAWP